MKRVIRIAGGVIAGVVLLALGLRWYLTSGFVAERVARELRDLYGGTVEVGGADVWLARSSASAVSFHENDCGDGLGPWLTVDEVETDLSVFDLLAGNATPQEVTLTGVRAFLRFDADGKLLTCVPSSLFESKSSQRDIFSTIPRLRLRKGELTLHKQGAEPIVLRNVEADLDRTDGRLVLSGNATSDRWGAWRVEGTWTKDAVRLVAKNEIAVALTPRMLAQIPFVPPAIWKHVEIESGRTPAEIALTYDTRVKTLSYRVQLAPVETRLRVEAIDFSAANARGSVVIEDGKVELRDVRAEAFGGVLRTDATLDFRGEVSRLGFSRIEGKGLHVERFPASWRFPSQITGELMGKALLEVALPSDPALRIHTTGKGRGKIVNAFVAGQPTAEPIGLDLRAVPGGFRFQSEDKEAGVSRALPLLPGSEAAARGVEGQSRDLETALVLLATGLLPPEAELVAAAGDDKKGKIDAKKDDAGLEVQVKESYLNINLKMKDIDLGKFARDLEFKLPFTLDGKISFVVKVGIPLDESKDLKKYRVDGSAELKDFVLNDLKLESLQAEINYRNGVLTMPKLKGRLAADVLGGTGGDFEGSGSFQVEPLGDLKLSVKLDHVPLRQLAQIGGATDPVRGDISGSLTALVPGKALKNPAAWQASATLRSGAVEAFGLKLNDAQAQVELAEGDLTLKDLRGKLEDGAVTASARLSLKDAFAFEARIAVKDIRLDALDRLKPAWRLPVALAGDLRTETTLTGTLSPLKVSARGDATANDLTIATLRFKQARFGWELSPERIVLKDVQAELYEGEARGAGSIPLRPDVAGELQLSIKGIDAGALTRDVPKMPVRIQGKISGDLKGTLPPVAVGKKRQVNVQLSLAAPRLRVQNVPTEQLKGTIEFKDGVADYRLEGKTLGGAFELEGQFPEKTDAKSKEGKLELRGISISRLLEALGMPDASSSYDGRLTLGVRFEHDKDGWPVGSGRLRVQGLRYKDSLLINEAAADVRLADATIRVSDFSTGFGDGIIRGKLTWNLRNAELGWFSLDLERISIAHLLGPWLGQAVEGDMHARLRGRLGREWSGTAEIEIGRAKILGLEVTAWRMPLAFRFAPAENRGRIETHDATATAGAGRFKARFELSWDHAVRTEGQIQFFRVDVETFLRQTFGPTRLAGGSMTGRFQFAGRDMRSLADLTGSLEASFEQSQALNLPVLKQASPFLGLSPSTTFQKGHVSARLADGVFRIQRLGLEGSAGQVYAEGTVSLEGRLNLDVMAATTNFGIDPRLRLLGLRIPLAGPVPLVVAQEAATLLSNRVIQLRVTGAVRSPNIRVLPLATITQGAIRFFLRRSVGDVPFDL